MKRIILALIMCFVCSAAHAQCVANNLTISKADNGGILVSAKFTLNGIDLGVDKKTYFPKDIKDLTPVQVKTAIEAGLKRQCDKLIFQAYKEQVKNPYIEAIEPLQTIEFTKLLQYEEQIKAISITSIEVKLKMDTDGDYYYDQEWTIKPDGTKTTKIITPELMP